MAAILTNDGHKFSVPHLDLNGVTGIQWADWWLRKAKEWAETPVWQLSGNRGEYDKSNFFADVLVGDLPWGGPLRQEVFDALAAHPLLDEINAKVIAKCGEPIFERKWADEERSESI